MLAASLLFERVYFELCGSGCDSLHSISQNPLLSCLIKKIVLQRIRGYRNFLISMRGRRARTSQARQTWVSTQRLTQPTTKTRRCANSSCHMLSGSGCQENRKRRSTRNIMRTASNNKRRLGTSRIICACSTALRSAWNTSKPPSS